MDDPPATQIFMCQAFSIGILPDWLLEDISQFTVEHYIKKISVEQMINYTITAPWGFLMPDPVLCL